MLSTGNLPVDGFPLSVASYVVKVKMGTFKRRKMCCNQGETQPFTQKRLGFVELLTRFELVTSSLPTAGFDFL